jgi:transcription-repair coupling factor (superfamily II helicase)
VFLERSLKEAAGELEARLKANAYRCLPIMGLKGAAQALMLRQAALRLGRPVLAITALPKDAEALAGELSFFMDQSAGQSSQARRVQLFPAWELSPFAHLSPSRETQAAQFAAMYAIRRGDSPLVVASVEALMMRTVACRKFDESIMRIVPADSLDLDALVDGLANLGYQRVPQVEELGDYCVRGGIIDLFPPLGKNPLRIELEDDIVISIRDFDPATQRSLGEVAEATIVRSRLIAPVSLKQRRVADRVAIRAADIGMIRKEVAEFSEYLENGLLFPGVELLLPILSEEALDSFFDYLPKSSLLWLIEPDRVLAHASLFSQRVAIEAEAMRDKHLFFPEPESLFLAAHDLERRLGDFAAVETESLITLASPREGVAPPIEINCQPSLKLAGQANSEPEKVVSLEPLAAELQEIRRSQGAALIVVEGASQIARLRRHLEAYEIEVNTDGRSFASFLDSPDHRPTILHGEIGSGTILQGDGIYIYSEEDIFGEPRVRRRARPTPRATLLNLEELKPGDHVVHLDHGIGLYRGLTHLAVAGTEGDFMNLEYAGDDKMYVPVERINLVQRYVGADGAEPKLDKLGSGSWARVKHRTRQAVLAMASELLEIYAAREVLEGHAFPHPGGHFHDFCDRFEFEETADQLNAIDDVIRDMTRTKPMDRLICGDAGFGKTEVALRAAFIAVNDGRQVATLVPTTVLAEQHWNTFKRRFKDEPVRVEMVSRFRSAKENKAVIEDLRGGKVDIVVGTHRLLQSDVEFKNLGLLIIDEEHRFGVADKEKIKKFRKLVDVLAMTGTPIPRTLHMAMLGIRDLSVIQTPPVDRQAIRTMVAHFDDGIIRDAVMRELNRGGQVFFVHNRVENIDYMAGHLRSLIPEARIAIGHGQMDERKLENVMGDFIEGRINLLVCSAIIESGLDIPNANTMIINRADHFGLAALYQLRGRVGRSRQKAYAYLLIPGEHIITRDAKRRIEVISELVEVGGGFKLAINDLELRGAGNLLGHQQSGQISEVGFELYTEMMEQAIHELRGEIQRPDFEPELQIGIPAYIPTAMVPDESERLVLYRRMARAQSDEDLDEMRDEMVDRFGPIPSLVENLLGAMKVRRKMKELLIVSAILKNTQLEIRFHPEAPLEVNRLIALADANRARIKLTANFHVHVRFEKTNHDQTLAEIEGVLQALAACEKLSPIQSREPRQLLN